METKVLYCFQTRRFPIAFTDGRDDAFSNLKCEFSACGFTCNIQYFLDGVWLVLGSVAIMLGKEFVQFGSRGLWWMFAVCRFGKDIFCAATLLCKIFHNILSPFFISFILVI